MGWGKLLRASCWSALGVSTSAFAKYRKTEKELIPVLEWGDADTGIEVGDSQTLRLCFVKKPDVGSSRTAWVERLGKEAEYQ